MPTLDWIGKKAVVNHHREVPYRLVHCDGALSAGDADSGNLLVQGDNLDALKALLPYYAGKVKCIYIDPPYNTGNEGWVYNDNVNSPEIKAWLGKTVGKEAEDLSRHDKWLCMMYPRLRLLREFLRKDGVIFVSISDESAYILDFLLRSIFGNRRLGAFIWRTKDSANDAERNFSSVHEHVVAYGNDDFDFYGTEIGREKYKNPDQDHRGAYSLDPITKAHDYKDRANTYYPIQDPKTGWWYPCNPDSVWRYASKARLKENQKLRSNTIEDLIDDDRIVFSAKEMVQYDTLDELNAALKSGNVPRDGKGIPLLRSELPDIDFWIGKPIGLGRPSKKSFWREKTKTTRPVSSIVSSNNEKSDFYSEKQGAGRLLLQEIFGESRFQNPKPLSLVRSLIYSATVPGDIILDSFAGSGTTGHAILELNKHDGGNRKFILVEMEEKIAQGVTAERLHRVIDGYDKGGDPGKPVEGLGGGFRFCELGTPLFNEFGDIDAGVTFPDLAAHIFFAETGSPLPKKVDGSTPFLGTHRETAVYLLFSPAEQGFAREAAGNVLTPDALDRLPAPSDAFEGQRVVYAEGCTVASARLKAENTVFKQIPYQVQGV